MPVFLPAQDFLNFLMFTFGMLTAWAAIKGLSDD